VGRITYSSILITGTDTGIGKTTVSCIMAASLRQRGLRVGVFKPAETGCANGVATAADVRNLKYFADCSFSIEALCSYALREPLAPMMAARIEGVRIDLDRIAQCHQQIVAAHDITLIEGAGGLLVPLGEGTTFVDLAQRLDAAVLVVVGNRLGAINHALLTIRYARTVGLNVIGYVINQIQSEMDLAASTNVALLEELLGPPLGLIPFVSELDRSESVRHQLAAIGEANLRLDALLIR